jgi:putative FmdB family regulatory protein
VPTYEYECDACGKRFEEFQSITAAPIRKCPMCGKRKVRRLIGAGAGIIFKGSGFYQTDYRSESYKSAAAKEKEKPAAAGDSKAAKPESKAAPARPAGGRKKG